MRKVHGWRRALRWVQGIMLGTLGLLTLAIAVAFIVFQTGWGREVLRSQIESRMADMFVGGATIGSVEGNPLSELVLNDVVINGPDHKPAITAKRLTVKLPLLPLISSQLRVDKLIAEDLHVAIKRDANGELQIGKLIKQTDKKNTWNIALPNLEVHRGHIAFDTGDEMIDIDNLEVYVDAKLPLVGPMIAAVTLDGQWRQRKAPISFAGSIYGDREVFAVRSAVGHVGEIKLAVAGARIPKGQFNHSYEGTVVVKASAAEVHRLMPKVHLPDDIAVAISAYPDGRLTYLSLTGTIGDAPVHAFGRADVQAKLVSGVVTADELDLTKLTKGTLNGRGGAVVAMTLDGATNNEIPTARAIITAWAKEGDAPVMNALIAVNSSGDRIRATVGAASEGLRAGFGADVIKRGESITLERGVLVASTTNVARATRGKAPLRGSLNANLRASGTLAPNVDLAVAGHADGRRLRMQDLSAASLRVRIDAKHLPSKPVGSARVELGDLKRGDMEFGKLTVAAGNRPDGKLQVSVRSQPKQAPWLIDADALVTTGDTMVVDLQRHFVRASSGAIWRGDTGLITITPRRIDLRDLHSKSRDGSLAVAGSFVRAGRGKGDLEAKLDATVNLQNFGKGYAGRVDAHVDVSRVNGRFAGNVVAKGSGVSLSPKSGMILGGEVRIKAGADQLLAEIEGTAGKAGSGKIALDVDAPKDISNVRAWAKLHRDSIRNAQLTLQNVDLEQAAKLAGLSPMTGRINGEVKLTPTTAGGMITIRGVQTKQTKDLGSINADVSVSQVSTTELKTTVTARLIPTPTAVAAKDVTKDGEARLFAEARFMSPGHIFDPAAWEALGARAFRGATLRAERLAFHPGTLERLGVVSQLRGELGVSAEIDEGMTAARFSVNVHKLRGGLLAEPVAIAVSGVVDDKSSRMQVSVHSDNIAIVRVRSSIPVTLAELRANPEVARTAPLKATATIDRVPARTLMTVLGTSQITGGTFDGKIEIAGTVAQPTVDAKLVAHDVTVPPEGKEPIQMVKKLTIAAKWDGTKGSVAIDGDETAGGKLTIRAAGSPDKPEAVTASLVASKLDLAPLVAFMPGPAGGLGGRMEANFKLRGIDPRTAEIAGTMHIQNGRIPIAPAVGTLFQGDLKLKVENKVVGLTLLGKLGRGDIKLVASAPLDGATRDGSSGKLELKLTKVQLIGTTEPILTGTVTADLARVGDRWRSNVRIERMTVKVPPERGQKLSPVGAPKDLVYGGEKIHHGKNKGRDVPGGIVHDHRGPADFSAPSQVEGSPAKRKTPQDPLLIANVQIRNTFVESEEVRGVLTGKLTVTVGDTKEVGVVGNIGLSRGVLDIFSRRYQVDKANLAFDGSPDPVLDIRVTHDFPEVTTVTEVRGRMSKPQLQLSSQPARYSQAELLGFLLGGEPGGDSENAPSASERVAGAGASFLSNKVGGYVKKALPVDVDVLRYEAATAGSSAAITVGTWITDKLFLAYRQHLEARPDENAGEGEVEYWIRRRLVLEGVAGDRGVTGLDLLWRRRW